MRSHTNEERRIKRLTAGCSQKTSRTRMTKVPEAIKTEGNEDVTRRIANDVDESSQRKI